MKQIAVVVDMQYDFLLGGKLYVPESERIFKAIYNICDRSDLVIATRDWHPPDHSSFAEQGGPWPKHCVAGEWGARIHKEVDKRADVIFSKGMEKEKEGYSATDNKFFIPFLSEMASRSTKIVVCGVALDYCVQATAWDLAYYGFDYVVVPEKATAMVSREERDRFIIINKLEKNRVVYERS